MQKIPLNIIGGGTLEIHGPWPAQRMLVIMHRDAFEKDRLLMARLLEGLKDDKWAVIRYEMGATTLRRAIDMSPFIHWPRPIRRAIRLIRLLWHPGGIRHVFEKCYYRQSPIEFRVRCLRALIHSLGPDKEISILGRSAGGRVATLLTDECELHRVICLGYPFRKPREPEDPERYRHLETLQTPCLIIQGERDSYGGAEAAGRYELSAAVRLKSVNTDHDFQLPDRDWEEVLAMIRKFAFEDEGYTSLRVN